jgi:hypothetical protein
VGVTEALGIINGGDESGGSDGPDAGHGAKALDARILHRDVLDHLIGIAELVVQGQRTGNAPNFAAATPSLPRARAALPAQNGSRQRRPGKRA